MTVYISKVSFETQEDGQCVGVSTPRISWRFAGVAKDWIQTRYELEIQRHDSEITIYAIQSGDSSYVPWIGRPLVSGESASVRVRAFGGKDNAPTSWSATATVEAGILNQVEWDPAMFIESMDKVLDGIKQPVLFRRAFQITKQVRRARLYISAHGIYEPELNGARVGDNIFAPGWTSYATRLQYQTFDISEWVREGPNVVGATVGEGWYCGRLGFNGGRRNIWGDRVGLLAKVMLTFVDGNVETINTDEQWVYSTGSILSSEFYDGEVCDLRLEKPGWSQPGFKDHDWSKVACVPLRDDIQLCTPDGPPVRRIQEVKAQKVFQSPSKKTVIDFGQNLVGWLRIKVSGPRLNANVLTFTHTEVLEHGECATRPLRKAAATDTLILSNTTSVTWEPRFTFHGFRYVQVDGWPAEEDAEALSLDGITAVVLHTDMERAGWFECSEPLLNKLHQNIVWSMKGNFLSVPTDCPQRDERLGWTGDICVFSNTANYLYDTSGMLNGWLKDLEAEQSINGVPPLVCPNVLGNSIMGLRPLALWGDCIISVPWEMYQAFGDLKFLRQKYASMKLWIDHGIPRHPVTQLWDPSYFQLGDWLDSEAPPDEPGNGSTDSQFVANAFLIRTTDMITAASLVLDLHTDTERYKASASELRAAFAAEYITPKGRLSSDTQTAYALALHFNLFPTLQQRETAALRLSQLILTKSRFKLSTGFAGTSFLGHALTAVDQTQLFYRMLLHRRNPSWLYPVLLGSTTVWERWDSMLADGTINPGEMTSFNHYSFGAVAHWMHSVMGGLRPRTPGWKEIVIEPLPGGSITWVETSHLTPYGMLRAKWEILGAENEKEFRLEVSIPPNTKAWVRCPGKGDFEVVGSGERSWEVPYKKPDWPPLPNYPPFFPHEDDEP